MTRSDPAIVLSTHGSDYTAGLIDVGGNFSESEYFLSRNGGEELQRKIGIYIDGDNIFHCLRGKRMDLAEFLKWLVGDRELCHAKYFLSVKPEQKPIRFEYVLDKLGYIVKEVPLIKNHQTKNWKSMLDTNLIMEGMQDEDKFETFVLVSGDSDFLPLVRKLEKAGKRIEIVSFQEALHSEYYGFNVRLIDDFIKEDNSLLCE